MADREKKRGGRKDKYLNYVKIEKSFLNEIKSIFQFFKGYHLVKKIKNSGHKV